MCEGERGRSPRAPQPVRDCAACIPGGRTVTLDARLDKRSAIGSGVSVTKEYRPWTPEQGFLLPPCPMEWLPEGHLAYVVLELVRELHVSTMKDAMQSRDARGVRPYSPRMLTALLLYAYCVGLFSSRKIERATSWTHPSRRRVGHRLPLSQPAQVVSGGWGHESSARAPNERR